MKWKLVKVGDVAKQVRGVSYKPSDVSETLDKECLPILRASNITDTGLNFSDFVYVNKRAISKQQMLKTGDIVIAASSGSKSIVGKAGYFEGSFEVSFGAFCKVIRPSENILPKYLSYYFTSDSYRKIISNLSEGANINNLRTEHLDNLVLPLPPFPTQQKIAAILDEADALRRKDKALLGKYEELLQAVFYDMFGDLFITGKKNKTEYLSTVGDLVSGVAKNTNTIKDDFVEVPYMRVANVQDGHINLNEIKSILVSQQDFNKYLLRENDLLLTEGGDPDKLGRGAVWKGQISPCIHQNHIFRIRITLPNLHPTYLSYLLSSRYGKAYFLKMAKQTTGIASINMTQLKNFQVIIPDFSLQKKFADVVENLERQKSKIIQQQTYSENLFQSLMQQAFKGELVS